MLLFEEGTSDAVTSILTMRIPPAIVLRRACETMEDACGVIVACTQGTNSIVHPPPPPQSDNLSCQEACVVRGFAVGKLQLTGNEPKTH